MEQAQNTWYESLPLCKDETVDKLTKKQLVYKRKTTSNPLKHTRGKLTEVFFTIFFSLIALIIIVINKVPLSPNYFYQFSKIMNNLVKFKRGIK